MLIVNKNRDNLIQNFHLGRYIIGYTFRNHVLRLCLRVAVKLNFRPYVRRYTSPNENFEQLSPKYMGLNVRKPVFRGLPKTQAQTSLRIRSA